VVASALRWSSRRFWPGASTPSCASSRAPIPADPGEFGAFLATLGVQLNDDLECVFAPPGDAAAVPVCDGDLFLTTSWWTTQATCGAVDPRRVIYLLQEDERMFYPHGDDSLRCAETLGRSDIHFVVNTEMLFQHLTEGDDALPNIPRRGCWFEPAFPLALYHDDVLQRRSRRLKNFVFYARPGDLRDLYWRGLEVVQAAIADRILPPGDWQFTFVGRDLEPTLLPRGVEPRLLQNPSWAQYASLIRQADIGLCLREAPHPCHPPLEMAASGAVVVTNSCGRKNSLSRYSENILCVPPSVDALKQGIAAAVGLAQDEELRAANFSRNGLLRDWTKALEPAVSRCAAWIA